MQYLLLVIGLVLIVSGYIELRSEVKILNKELTKKYFAVFDFIFNGGASGIGQIIGGIICFIIFVLSYFIK